MQSDLKCESRNIGSYYPVKYLKYVSDVKGPGQINKIFRVNFVPSIAQCSKALVGENSR